MVKHPLACGGTQPCERFGNSSLAIFFHFWVEKGCCPHFTDRKGNAEQPRWSKTETFKSAAMLPSPGDVHGSKSRCSWPVTSQHQWAIQTVLISLHTLVFLKWNIEEWGGGKSFPDLPSASRHQTLSASNYYDQIGNGIWGSAALVSSSVFLPPPTVPDSLSFKTTLSLWKNEQKSQNQQKKVLAGSWGCLARAVVRWQVLSRGLVLALPWGFGDLTFSSGVSAML